MTIALIVFLAAAAAFVFYLHRCGVRAEAARALQPVAKDPPDAPDEKR